MREQVDLTGFEVVENPALGEGCSSSIVALIAGRGDAELADVRVPGPIPPDVDSWADDEAALAAAGLN